MYISGSFPGVPGPHMPPAGGNQLFGNSAAEMTDAIHMVEAMHSFDEAEDYFYGDLGWDRESDDVKEFMAIIKNHFL